MKRKLVNTQLTNILTIRSYQRRMCSMAENVLLIKNVPEYIDLGIVNKKLLKTGAVVWFVDEVFGLLCLPYVNVNIRDMYGRPVEVRVISENGVYQRTLKNEIGKPPEFVIMYDNSSRVSIYPDILQLSERIALSQRVQDINILQQKTPRIWLTSDEKVQSLKDTLHEVDANESEVITLDNDFMKDTNVILNPAPYVADKLGENKLELWNEFLTLIGVANTSFTKKERNITDEVRYSQGGTVANRFSRFEARKKAIDMINKYLVPLHNTYRPDDKIENLELEFYDGLPTTLEIDDGLYEDEIVYNEKNEEV